MKPFSDNATPYPSWEYNDNIRVSIPFYESFHEETVDLVKTLKPEARVWLDTGCGTGYLVSRAFPHFPHTCFILADPSEGMLTQARHRLQQVQILIPPDRIRFLDPAGTEDLPRAVDPGEDLPDTIIRQPEVISAIQCHHYLKPEQRRTATQVCFNLLAQGGVYITFENIRPDSDQGVNLSLARWKRFQMFRGRAEEAAEAHCTRFNQEYFPITVNEHLSLLKECGFSVTELFWYSYMQAGFYAIK